jgi:hypothetical protein
MHVRTLAMIATLLLAAWTWRAAGVSAAPSLAPAASPVIAAATLQASTHGAASQKSAARERRESSAAALPRLRAGQIAQRVAAAP